MSGWSSSATCSTRCASGWMSTPAVTRSPTCSPPSPSSRARTTCCTGRRAGVGRGIRAAAATGRRRVGCGARLLRGIWSMRRAARRPGWDLRSRVMDITARGRGRPTRGARRHRTMAVRAMGPDPRDTLLARRPQDTLPDHRKGIPLGRLTGNRRDISSLLPDILLRGTSNLRPGISSPLLDIPLTDTSHHTVTSSRRRATIPRSSRRTEGVLLRGSTPRVNIHLSPRTRAILTIDEVRKQFRTGKEPGAKQSVCIRSKHSLLLLHRGVFSR